MSTPISSATTLTAATIAAGDLFPLLDVSAAPSSKAATALAAVMTALPLIEAWAANQNEEP